MKCNTVSVIKILNVLLIFVFVQICTEIMEIKLMLLLLLHLWGTIFTYKFVLNFLSFARICIETSTNKWMFRLLFCSYVNTYKVPSRGFSWNVPFRIILILLPSRYLEEQTIVKRTWFGIWCVVNWETTMSLCALCFALSAGLTLSRPGYFWRYVGRGGGAKTMAS